MAQLGHQRSSCCHGAGPADRPVRAAEHEADATGTLTYCRVVGMPRSSTSRNTETLEGSPCACGAPTLSRAASVAGSKASDLWRSYVGEGRGEEEVDATSKSALQARQRSS